MKAAFYRAIEDSYPLTDPSFLSHLHEAEFKNMIRGKNNLQLIPERVNHLRQVGRVLTTKYNEDVMNIIEKGKGDAINLLDEITNNFKCYDDSTNYYGHNVMFNKRAQLFVSNTENTLRVAGKEGLKKVNELTALADYKVPQILRHFGILDYSPKLVSKIDNKQIIEASSPEEIEIRAFTIETIEKMTNILKVNFPDINAIVLDKYLYHESKVIKEEMQPHHRAISTAH